MVYRKPYLGMTMHCARRMGPMMAVGGMKEEKCKERGAIGPYPYAVGMLQVLSRPVATWMVAQPAFAEFERRATAATRRTLTTAGRRGLRRRHAVGRICLLSRDPCAHCLCPRMRAS